VYSGRFQPAPADLESAVAEDVEEASSWARGAVAQVVVRTKVPAHARRRLSDRGQRQKRRELVEQVIGNQQRRVAQGLGGPRVFGQFGAIPDAVGADGKAKRSTGHEYPVNST
jgi:hypothetical protein